MWLPRASLAVGEVARRLEGDQQLRISAAGFAAAEDTTYFCLMVVSARWFQKFKLFLDLYNA